MREKLFVGNWKMHKTLVEARNFMLGFKSLMQAVEAKIVVCAPFTSLSELSGIIDHNRLCLGAQNVSFETEGAFTGEVSARMLREIRCDYVIIGHSERRSLFSEQTSSLVQKVKQCFKHNLVPIYCVGEKLEERESLQHEDYVKEQLLGLFKGVGSEITADNFVLAYEPIWAIGTGNTASSGDAQNMHRFIRKVVLEHLGEQVAKSIKILYGGSVKPNNASELLQEADIDGVLVGGASLDVTSFSQIIKSSL